jgi:Kef-type K+ transport system membrane component KefB
VCLIALAAGGELNLKRMRPLFGTIARTVVWVVGASTLSSTVALMLLNPWLPFLHGRGAGAALAISAVIAVSLSAMSPAVVMALLSETRADGPLSRTMLGVVVAADLAVIVSFAVVASGAQAVLGASTSASEVALHVSWELFGSALAGVVIGAVLALYLRKVREGQAIFVLLTCVIMSEIGSRLAFDPLIVALVAGLFMENVAEIETTKLIHEIEAGSLPVYIVFFAVAGAALRLDVLSTVAIPALALVAVRFASIYAASRAASRAADADPAVTRWAFSGYLPQAGLALALPLLYPEVLPGIGEGPGTLVLGVVGINQVVMPVLLRIALTRSGEAGRAPKPESGDAPAPIHPAAATK